MPIGMSWRKESLIKIVVDPPIRLVVTLAFLILDNAYLVIEFFLRDGTQEVPHSIRLKPKYQIQCRRGHGLEVIGSIQPGRSIQPGSTDLLHRLKPFTVIIFTTVEHKMFKQMRETCFARWFVF